MSNDLIGLAAREHLDPQPAPTPTIDTRLAELAAMQDGWLDGAGKAPTPAALACARSYARTLCALGMPVPHMYPTDVGGVLLEWDHADQPTLRIGPGPDDMAEFHALTPDDTPAGRFVDQSARIARQAVAGDAPPAPAGGHPVLCHASDPTTAFARCTLAPGHEGPHRQGVREWPRAEHLAAAMPCGQQPDDPDSPEWTALVADVAETDASVDRAWAEFVRVVDGADGTECA